jgi:hypothetical protein
MSEGAALVRFHDWRAHGLVAVPVSIGLATLVLAVGQVMLLHPAAYKAGPFFFCAPPRDAAERRVQQAKQPFGARLPAVLRG